MAELTPAPRVAVAGGGIAGIAAALRLMQRGYAVTLYEEKPWLGGNLASHQDAGSGVYHDVYPHMFSNFYVNFWDIVEKDLGLKRDATAESDFSARDSMKFIDRAGRYSVVRNAASLDPRAFWGDLFSGMAQTSPLDMYLYLYSMVDLLAHRFGTRGLLAQSVNGYVRSRPCATDSVARLHDAIVMLIWSIHSDATSAASYQNFYRHAFGNVTPLLWLLKGSLQQKIIQPLDARLRELGCDIRLNTSVRRIVFEGQRAAGIEVCEAGFDPERHQVNIANEQAPGAPFDHLVLALPPKALGHIAAAGPAGERLSSRLPQLAHAGKRLPAEPIAVMDVYFKRKIDGIPPENVAATDSDCYFSFIDLSQLWTGPEMEGITALTLASSDYWALPSDDDDENAHHLLGELRRYVPTFDPGSYWGDPASDIDWERSHYHSNKDDIIFVNQVGSWDYRPEPSYAELPNLYFAGDFCRNQVDMATVEAAVTSGLDAAAAVQRAAPLGAPIEVLRAPMVPELALGALKLLLLPSAYAAKTWLTVMDAANKLAGTDPAADLTHDLTGLMKLPYACAADCIDTLGAMLESVARDVAQAPVVGTARV